MIISMIYSREGGENVSTPKRIANKRDKDQMRVWSDDQRPPIIKDYDSAISSIREHVNAQGQAIRSLQDTRDHTEQHWGAVIKFDLTIKCAYSGVSPIGINIESPVFAGLVKCTFDVDDLEADGVFPEILDIPVDLQIQKLVDDMASGDPVIIGELRYTSADLFLQIERLHQDPEVVWTKTVENSLDEGMSVPLDIFEKIGYQLGIEIAPAGFQIYACSDNDPDDPLNALHGFEGFHVIAGSQQGSGVPELSTDYHAVIILHCEAGLIKPDAALEYDYD